MSIFSITAKPHWNKIAFASDIHLHEQDPLSADYWHQSLAQLQVQALFLLGDIFDAWIGDDCLFDAQLSYSAFAKNAVQALKQASERMSIYCMQGNRDFLMGSLFAEQAHVSLIPDPCILILDQKKRLLLSHGDAWCTDDLDYQAFRKQVRQAQWQTDFLNQDLQTRYQQAQAMRKASLQYQTQKNKGPMDINVALAIKQARQYECQGIIHGHTHCPQLLPPIEGISRRVLTDWHCHDAVKSKGHFWIYSFL